MRPFALLLFAAAFVAAQEANNTISLAYDSGFQFWRLSNGVIEAQFRLDRQQGFFALDTLRHVPSASSWRRAAGRSATPVEVTFRDGTRLDAHTEYLLVDQFTEAIERRGQRQVIRLREAAGNFEVTVHLEMYPGEPVLRHRAFISNRRAQSAWIRQANLTPWELFDNDESYTTFHVNQWGIAPREANFEPVETKLAAEGTPVVLNTGSGGSQCSWLVVQARDGRGLFAGIEFNGRATMQARHLTADRILALSSSIDSLFHEIKPGESFEVPAAFLGLFQGDWDEAGFRTQRFVENVLAARTPDEKFPYVAWDSWGYEEEIHEDSLRREAALAAAAGAELFIVDLGWAKRMGDWQEDPAKFPSGLRALSDYVHSLGMKFGLHFAFSEADPESDVLTNEPDWRSSETYFYHGGESLCLGHAPVREWIVREGVSMIRNYNVDWILQDGQTLVKNCTKSTHTHHAQDSNYANSVEGLDLIVDEIRKRTGVVWENCANGGSMMTFKMVQNYVTSITNDASGALDSRHGAYGATFPFPPRYTDRYMVEQRMNTYATRSYMFGGPWILMNKLTQMSDAERALLAREIRIYKAMRGLIKDGKVGHLTAAPEERRTDAIQSYNAARDTAIAIVTRELTASAAFTLRLKDLNAQQTYRVRFETDSRVFTLTGRQLMNDGVTVSLPELQSAEIVYVEPQ